MSDREALTEDLAKVYAEATGYYVPFHRGLSSVSADQIRTGIRAVVAHLDAAGWRPSQPAPADDEVVAFAKRMLDLQERGGTDGRIAAGIAMGPQGGWIRVARALLAETAARKAAERERDTQFVPKSWLEYRETEVARLREAVTAAIGTLALVERPAFKDREHGAAVEALGRRIGYGALMASASASWREGLGSLAGGEYVAGPCHSTVVATLAELRAALAPAAPEAAQPARFRLRVKETPPPMPIDEEAAT